MKQIVLLIFVFSSLITQAQLPAKWEELSAPQFAEAVALSGKVCVVPLGIVEKHGPSLPTGTDLMIVRDLVVKAAKQEYVVIFPEVYAGQINEARHQPGTIAYSPELVWKILEETCEEIARNGFEKIILVNGHGGNNAMLSYFAMAILNKKHNYSVYLANGWDLYANARDKKEVSNLLEKLPEGSLGHAGADEAAQIMIIRPDLFKPEKALTESGKNLARLKDLTMVTSGIDWYASFPNHYAGNAASATKELGNAMINATVNGLVKAFQEVKTDTKVYELQNEFFEKAEKPLDIK